MQDSEFRPTPMLLAALALAAGLAACASHRTRHSDDAIVREGGEYHAAGRVGIGDERMVRWDRRAEAPSVRVWLDDSRQTYRPGDRVRALFRVQDDGYVTILRVDTDGRLRVLYPRAPYEDNWVRAGRTYRVPGTATSSFLVDDPTGVGYVFAISSYEPFDYSPVSYRRAWDYDAIGERVRGDPFVAVRRFADRIALDDRTGYATAYDEYYVGRRVQYPRYACYDCHGLGAYPVHDPYGRPCPRYVVVVYRDRDYYPYRYYPGTRVVYSPRPRYEFKPAVDQPTGSSAGGASPNEDGSAGVKHRRPIDDVDRRRPNSPTNDPNIEWRTPGTNDAGATRPGDEVRVPTAGGRRREDDPADAPSEPSREGLRTPRQDGAPSSTPSPTPPAGGGGGDDSHERGNGRGPRRDPPGQPPSGGDPHNDPSDGRAEDRGRGEGRRGDDSRRADPERVESARADGSQRGDGEGPRRVSWPGASGENRARVERRAQPTVEPRAEPQDERRGEPRAERREASGGSAERRGESKPETKSGPKPEARRDDSPKPVMRRRSP